MKLAIFAIALGVSLGVTGCKSSYKKKNKKAERFEALLEAETGHDYSVEKLFTSVDGYVVFKDEVTGEYVAYNINKYDKATMTNFDHYLTVAVPGTDIVHNLYRDRYWVESKEFDGENYVDNSYWHSDFYGGGWKFDNANTPTKDLELLASLDEAAAQKFVAVQLSSQYSLSSDRAFELSKLVTKYHKLENLRELTESEKSFFAIEALGVSISEMTYALRNKLDGYDQAYNELLKKAAQTNRTTPEKISMFLNEFVDINE